MHRIVFSVLFVLYWSSAFGTGLFGRLDYADMNEVRGYGCDQTYPSDALTMQVYVDNNIYAGTCTANQEYSTTPISSTCGGSTNRGFQFRFSESVKRILRTGRHTITVRAVSIRTSSRTVILDGCPANIPTQPTPFPTVNPTFPPGRAESLVTGFLDSANTTAAVGWACDPTQPNIRLQVNFYVDNTVFAGTTLANIQREQAVGLQCGGDAAHGFSIYWTDSVRNLLRDGNQHFISAFAVPIPTGNPVQLQNSPQRVLFFCAVPSATSPPTRIDLGPTGVLDSATTTMARGWACDPAAPNTALFVDFYINGGYYAGRTLANVQREAAVTQQCGSANHGFEMYFPTNVQQYVGQQRGVVRLSAVLNYGNGRTATLNNSPIVIRQ